MMFNEGDVGASEQANPGSPIRGPLYKQRRTKMLALALALLQEAVWHLPILSSSVHPDVGGGYVALISIGAPHTHPAVALVWFHHTELLSLLHAYGALAGACSR